jgi:hypothetical protein
MGESIDSKLLRTEQMLKYDNFAEPVVCLRGLLEGEPSTADGKYAQKTLLNMLDTETGNGSFECWVDNCQVRNYLTQPHNPEAIDINGRTFTPLTGTCRFEDFCLSNDWDLIKKASSVPIGQAVFKAVRMECSAVFGCARPGSYNCPNPDCDMSAGVSEDGVPGKSGQCAKQKEAHEEPQVVSSEPA